jgi:hypothetical protein
MPALIRRAVLNALLDPKFLAELPEGLHDELRVKVAQAGDGTYAAIQLGPAAGPVRDAAKRLRAKGGVSAKLAATLPELERIPGY